MDKAEQPTITQADRDAAVEYFDPATFSGRDAWLRGDHDDDPLVQAFAKHRTTSLAAQDGLVEALLRDCHRYLGAMTTQNKRGEILYRRLSAALSAIKEQHHD